MDEFRSDWARAAFQAKLLQIASASGRLSKFPLCLLIACSTAFGCRLVPSATLAQVTAVSSGVLLLAMGAATLNSIQEVREDGNMKRTRNRPLVRGDLSKGYAMGLAGLLVCGGLMILEVVSSSSVAPSLGLLALLLYNGLYTPLKKTTLYALVPGAICGAIPPLIGLAAMGTGIVSHQALQLAVLLVLWQIPHFLLVQLRHSDDYLVSAYPNLLQQFTETGLRKVAVVWINSLGFMMLLFTLTPMVANLFQCSLVVINALSFSLAITGQLLSMKSRNYRLLFIALNAMLVVHMVLLAL